MADNCKGALSAAVKGAFSQDEIDGMVERFAAKKLKVKRAKPALSEKAAIREAARDMAVDEAKAALVSRRAEGFAKLARATREADYARMSGTGADKLEAMTIGSDAAGYGGRNSVDAMGSAYSSELIGEMERGLRAAGVWKRAAGSIRDLEWQRKVAIEMSRLTGGKAPATGDATAEAAARVMAPLIDKGRRMQNGVGAWIGALDGYIARQNHDPIKVSGGFWRDFGKSAEGRNQAQREAFQQWYSDILPKLDDKTFENLKASGNGDIADRRQMLEGIWYNIVTGNHATGKTATVRDDLEGIIPKAGKAKSVSAERVLHFKSPEDWWGYHQKYGQGDLFAVVTGDLERAARNTALMKRFGPNPQAAWENDVKAFDTLARNQGDANAGQKINSKRIQSAFDQVSGGGDAPENLRLAYVGSLLRKHQSVSKLGALVLSAFPDLGVAANHLMQAGVPMLDAYGGVLGGLLRLGGKESRQAADLLDVGARMASGHLTSGVTLKDGALGVYTYLGRLNFALQGFDHWNKGLRAGVAGMFSRHLGNHAHLELGQLPADLRELMGRYGIDAADWDAIRKGVSDIDGGKHVGFDGIGGDAELKTRAMMNDLLDNATSEARAREKRDMNFGSTAGSVWGEAVRALMQFKSFPLTYVNRTLTPAVRAAQKGNFAPIANLIVSTMLLGYLSVQAKQLVKGREARPLNWQTVAASMVQGGGLGIYGDFLFGERNRFGGGLAETFGGPVVGDLHSLIQLYDAVKTGEAPGAQAFQLGKSELPFVNLWYTRAALDYLVFWRMQEAISPGWAARHQRNVEKQTGSEFWLKPTEAVGQ